MNMLRAVMAGLCVVSLCAGAAQAKPSVHPVGTLRYDPAKCWNSYVILANEGGSGGSAKLIDRNGNLVHEWDQKGGQGFPNKVYPGGYLGNTRFMAPEPTSTMRSAACPTEIP